LAYAGLADAYTFLGDVGLTAIRPLDAFTTARQAALAAIELDETLSEGHTALAHIDMHCYRWAEARRAFDRAIELGPNYPHSRQLNAFYLAFNGQLKEAQAEIRRALRLDPLSLAITNDVGVIHYFAREYDQAIECFQGALELSANFDRSHHWMAAAYEQKNCFDEAISHYRMAIGNIESRASLAHAYARSGYKSEAIKIRAELLAESCVKYVSPYDLAMIHLGLDEREHALSQLRKACEEHSGWMIYLTVDPRLDPIRSEPAFQAILKIVGFESEQRS
jgi:tetratricopeptide (TPR) repeat protein